MIHVSQSCVGEEEVAAAQNVLKTCSVACGPEVEALEHEFCELTGMNHGVACSSGTAALMLALQALDVRSGDEVIVPSLAFTGTASPAVRERARIDFADIASLDTPTLDAEDCADRVGMRTHVVVFPTYAGYPGTLADVESLCRRYDLHLVVDASHAPGATVGPRNVASFGECAAFSFYSGHNITCGEGGILVTNNEELYHRCLRLRNHGLETFADMDADGCDYRVGVPAWNARLSDLAAAVARPQLKKLPAFNARRRELTAQYDRGLADLHLTLPFARRREGAAPNIYPILLPDGVDRRSFRQALAKRGIETAIHYIPLHKQPAYAEFSSPRTLIDTETYCRRAVSLPLHVKLTDKDVDTVVGAVHDALAKLRKTAKRSARPAKRVHTNRPTE